ncbi:HAD family hydrolase [Arthrobacter antioxidans]|uniref:HAD family hydrolase n=1 Tax=Arthrobacter antioxidans TaxID=2895818 RepID=UPI001FFF4D3A|nr:HAD family hydrolase [Arthrobacter antioxidans]
MSFDLDGTLVISPFAGVLRSVAAEVAAEIAAGTTDGIMPGARDHAVVPPEPAGRGERDRRPVTSAEVAAAILAEHERRLLTDPYAAYDWASIVATTADRFGSRWAGTLVPRLEDALTDAGVRILHDNTLPGLDALRAAGCRLVLLTNGRSEFQLPVLRAAGLQDAFDAVITSDAVGAAKPDPAMFERALGERRRLVHVGDRLDHDIAGANGAGALSILLRPDAPGDGMVATSSAGIRLTDNRGGVGPDISDYLLARYRIEAHSPSEALPPASVPHGVARSLDAAVALILEVQSAAP